VRPLVDYETTPETQVMTAECTSSVHAVIENEHVVAVPAAPIEQGSLRVSKLSPEFLADSPLNRTLLIDKGFGFAIRAGTLGGGRSADQRQKHDACAVLTRAPFL